MLKRPDQYLLPMRVVQKRWYFRQVYIMQDCHRIFTHLEFSELKWPWYMMYITTVHTFSRHNCVKTVTLSKPLLERALLCEGDRCYGTKKSLKFCGRCALMGTATVIVNSIVYTFAAHHCIEIRQAK